MVIADAMHGVHAGCHIVHSATQGPAMHDPVQVVALSPDAPDVLERVQPGDVYVIGGIIDRTPHKYVSLFYAHKHRLKVWRPSPEQ